MDKLAEKIDSICSSYVFEKTDGEGYFDVSKFPKSGRKMFECYENRTSRWAFASLTMQDGKILGFMNEDFEDYVMKALG